MFFFGFILCVYPIFAGFVNDIKQKGVIGTYESELKDNEDLIVAEKEKAKKYNDALYQEKNNAVVLNGEKNFLSDDDYYNIYDITGTGIMGSIEIPDINVKLPVYHGTDEKVLSSGAGHMEGTSIPIGGVNSHSVITGHRGLPNANLFLRLDELKEGNIFYVNTGDDKLAYRIISTTVVEPNDMEPLEIKEGRDLVSLVTCTPYGINTHRLIVTGERTTFAKEDSGVVINKELNVSIRKIIMMFLPFILLIIGVIIFVSERKRRD